MGIFQKAKNEMAYLKAGMQGFSGSGKTFSASMIAIGLHYHVKSVKPVYFLDTETGSDYVLKHFKSCGIELMTSKTRAFVELLKGIKEAEQGSDILIIDSITHFWGELINAYCQKMDKKRLSLKDWALIKPEWRQFTDLYLNSKLHIIMCGRAGWDFDWEEDDEGTKELMKTGSKMIVEGQTGFEPSLNLEMERVRSNLGRIGSAFDYRMWVLKDRFNLVNGKFWTFAPVSDDKLIYDQNPVFKMILPHISALNLGGDHKAIEGGASTGLFNSKNSAVEYAKQKDIAIEEIESEIKLWFPSHDAESTKIKLKLIKEIFGTTSSTAIKDMKLDDLLEKKKKLFNALQNGKQQTKEVKK